MRRYLLALVLPVATVLSVPATPAIDAETTTTTTTTTSTTTNTEEASGESESTINPIWWWVLGAAILYPMLSLLLFSNMPIL